MSNPIQTSTAFTALGLSADLAGGLERVGYATPTPIQRRAIPIVLEGRDVLACAQTGTGKTAAFALPILQHISRDRGAGRTIRALVLAPTRELAAQIDKSFATYGGRQGPRSYVVFGGVGKQGQIAALRRGVEVLVATPGRLLDLLQGGDVDLGHVETFVLDEADRMLDMGFIHDVRRIARALPKKRQTLMFSATLPQPIRELAGSVLHEPVSIAVDPISSTCAPIAQSVYFVEKARKASLLIDLLAGDSIDRALVFTRTKHGANRVTRRLVDAGVGAAAIHGNKSQSARVRTLADFAAGRVRVVVATDIAARGIDIKDLSHVINFDLPNEPESYVHRVGRTGRAGASGVAVSFCSSEERGYLRDIERLTQRRLETMPPPAASSQRSRPVRSEQGRASESHRAAVPSQERNSESRRPVRSEQGRTSESHRSVRSEQERRDPRQAPVRRRRRRSQVAPPGQRRSGRSGPEERQAGAANRPARDRRRTDSPTGG